MPHPSSTVINQQLDNAQRGVTLSKRHLVQFIIQAGGLEFVDPLLCKSYGELVDAEEAMARARNVYKTMLQAPALDPRREAAASSITAPSMVGGTSTTEPAADSVLGIPKLPSKVQAQHRRPFEHAKTRFHPGNEANVQQQGGVLAYWGSSGASQDAGVVTKPNNSPPVK